METAIGVFDSRDLAEQAVKDLLGKGVPQDAIVFLTSSEREATEFEKKWAHLRVDSLVEPLAWRQEPRR